MLVQVDVAEKEMRLREVLAELDALRLETHEAQQTIGKCKGGVGRRWDAWARLCWDGKLWAGLGWVGLEWAGPRAGWLTG